MTKSPPGSTGHRTGHAHIAADDDLHHAEARVSRNDVGSGLRARLEHRVGLHQQARRPDSANTSAPPEHP